MKILSTSDQFNIIVFDNMYVEHKSSNSGHKILINGTLTEIDITLKFDILLICKVNLIMSV